MECPDKEPDIFRLININIDGLATRFIDLQHYMLREKADFVCIQEARVERDFNPRLGGYEKFILPRSEGIHGLVTFIKSNIAVTPVDLNFGPCTENQAFIVTVKNNTFLVVNLYVKDGMLLPSRFPDEIYAQPTLMVGDLNARHPLLGSVGTTLNPNGRRWYNFVSDNSDITLIGDPKPTHKRGGRIDYACLFHDTTIPVQMHLSDEFQSDHYAMILDYKLVTCDTPVFSRPRLIYDKRQEKTIMHDLNNWYTNFSVTEATNDSDDFNDSLVQELHKLFGAEGKFRPKYRPPMKENKRWYNDDPVLKRISIGLRKAIRSWKSDPTETKKTIIKNLERQYREAKLKSKTKYWLNFVNSLNSKSTSRDVWTKINIAKGIKRKEKVSHNPQDEANHLASQWADSSNPLLLPKETQSTLHDLKSMRKREIKQAIQRSASSDVDFTENEFQAALKKGKSTAPGEDGVTYDIIALVALIDGNPLLKLFNLVYRVGKLPKAWKKYLMIPIPKPGDPNKPRPISLCSCICKTFERMVLNRLLHIMNGKFSHNMYGFLPGRGTAEAIASFHASPNRRYTVFVDLKSAFDKANVTVILYNLCKFSSGKLVNIIKSYMSPRDIEVCLQGKKSQTKTLSLGTPQGGVLSPTLYNILMNPIADMKLPKHCNIQVYADDIVIQSSTHEGMKIVLSKLNKLCQILGIEISKTKTKAILTGHGRPAPLDIGGDNIEFVPYYKYLGTIVGAGSPARDMERDRVIMRCQERLRPLRALAGGSHGANATVLKIMYTGLIRPIIDYAASTLITLGMTRIQKIETVQNEALRIILGVNRTAKVECLRKEAGIVSLYDRIKEINLNTCARVLSDSRDSIAKEQMLRLRTIGYSPWIKRVRRDLEDVGLRERIYAGPVFSKPLEPWLKVRPDIRIHKSRKKDTVPEVELKQIFLSHINECCEVEKIHNCYYTDGSLLGDGRAGSAMLLIGENTQEEVGVRLGHNASSTQSEIFALLLALKDIRRRKISSVIICDSQAALLSLQSRRCKCKLHEGLINRAHTLLSDLSRHDIKVVFLWVPSHVGINGNERVDKLAKTAALKEECDYDFGISRDQCKARIRNIIKNLRDTEYRNLSNISPTISFYNRVSENLEPVYCMKSFDRATEICYSRIKLGYKYTWEFLPDPDEVFHKCKLCHSPRDNKLEHYLLNCPMIAVHRLPNCHDIVQQARHILVPDRLSEIVRRYRGFAKGR